MIPQQEVSVRLQKLHSATLVVALVLASALVVTLAFQKRDLMERLQEAGARSRDPHRGLYLPAVDIETVAGDSVRLGESANGGVQVLFVFNTTCEFCKASLPAWKQIASELGGKGDVQIYGVSLRSAEETEAFVSEHGIGFPVVSLTDRKLRALYRSHIVPQTVVLDSDGRVEYARVGAVTEDAVIDSIIAQTNSTIGRATWVASPTIADSLP